MWTDMDIRDWHRLTFNGTPVYVLPDGPDWILPNPGGDKLIQTLINAPCTPMKNGDILSHARARQLYNELIQPVNEESYPGRGSLLHLARLRECWFHITDKCNLACRHCMFSCSPADTATMALEDFSSFFLQAFDLGARTFFLTGGEPMVHPDFEEICTRVLAQSPDTCLVILTNGLLVDAFLPFLSALPQERVHFQVSLDGEQATHDWIRGKGTHERLLNGLGGLTAINRQVSLAMAVSQYNLDEMPGLVDVAARYDITNIHYLWMFARGNSEKNSRIPCREVFTRLVAAHEKAVKQGISIDNIDTIERQVFSPRGTKYDLSTAGWESLALGPGGNVYPTPALVREPKALCGNAHEGLEKVWKGSSQLSHIRSLSIVGESSLDEEPLKFLTGGGDLDHSFYHSGLFAGHDPYMDLYGHIALWCITRSPRYTQGQGIDIPLSCVTMRMGDRLLNCDDAHGQVALTHSNCVLFLGSLTGNVSGFYAKAAKDTNQDIINPVCYPEEEISHVPPTARIRSYGCGSPVLDAGVSPGETLVDLGSGAGMECFIAARKVGRSGRVFGIDMTDSMLALANQSLGPVEIALGYQNVQFKKALLEDLGLVDDSTDVVISNCVINLSPDKHRTFGEIFRILKPGGRLVISDIVTDTPPEPAILNDPLLRGECIAGALTLTRLMAFLEMTGFENIRIFKRFFYRQVMGHRFYSVTYQAYKPGRQGETKNLNEIIYPGPFAAVMTDKGELLLRGEKKKMDWQVIADDPVFILDAQGNAANIKAENSCACYLPPEAKPDPVAPPEVSGKKKTGCMECGKPLQYLSENKFLACSHCGIVKSANAICEAGHFICDTCHSKDALTIVTDICLTTSETDMIKILNTIRNHPAMPLHGPEHHFAVPGAIVAAYKNAGGNATREKICAAIERGKAIPGGSCGFWGGCGAALGVGIAFGIILESSPMAPGPRQMVQQVAGKIILKLSRIEASRCCQREAWTAMLIARDLSKTLLPVALRVDENLVCTQMGQNKECPGGICRFFKKAQDGLKLIF
jgi:MoaA/NifB/PqqE/SkfB family radical SAM enzyme/ubiquinone/menaquinone biosynthesis C-methylase UbiE